MDSQSIWQTCHIHLRTVTGCQLAICDWSLNKEPGTNGLRNLYIVPRSVTRWEPEPEGEGLSHLAQDMTISHGSQPSAPAVQPTLGSSWTAVIGFINRLFAEQNVAAAFLLPAERGYTATASFPVDRLAGSVFALSSQSFISAGHELTPLHSATLSYRDLEFGLKTAIGAVRFSVQLPRALTGGFPDLEQELNQRLSFPWRLSERPQERRVCVVLDPVSPNATRARWESTAALGVKVVVLSSGSWWATGGTYSHLDLNHLRESFVSVDLTPDENLWRRIAGEIKAYPYLIHGIFTPKDTYLVSVARAAEALGLPTNGPDPYLISTDKVLTRQLVDPNSKSCFPVRSVRDTENRLAEAPPMEFPVICKPSVGKGSEGVFKANNPKELRDVVIKTLASRAKDRRSNGLLIEPYVNGPEVDANLILRDGNLLYAEVVDDFPSPAELECKSAASALFLESQAVTPSKLPWNEQEAVIASMMDVIRLQGFHTGIFHCEARIRNSQMEYVLANESSIPDLQPSRNSSEAGQPTVFLHEVNARIPGIMSSAASLTARGIDFWALQVLCAIGDWERYGALSTPFRYTDQAMAHVILTNVNLVVSVGLVQQTFPGVPIDQLETQYVEGNHDPMLELTRKHPDLASYLVRHVAIVKSAEVYGSPRGKWLWNASIVLRSVQGRNHLLDVAERYNSAYETIVTARDQIVCLCAASVDARQ